MIRRICRYIRPRPFTQRPSMTNITPYTLTDLEQRAKLVPQTPVPKTWAPFTTTASNAKQSTVQVIPAQKVKQHYPFYAQYPYPAGYLPLPLPPPGTPPMPLPPIEYPPPSSASYPVPLPPTAHQAYPLLPPSKSTTIYQSQSTTVTYKATTTTPPKRTRPPKKPLSELETYIESLPDVVLPADYTVVLAKTRDQVDEELKKMIMKECVFGVDMEWKPSFRRGVPQNPVGLIQICGANKILLIQVAQMGGLSQGLVDFMKDPAILKTGVNIRGDGVKLYNDYRVLTDGLLDLRPLATKALQVTPAPACFNTSKTLRSLTGIFLHLRADKGKVRMSNWNRETLDAKQIEYAANDAYISYALYHTLMKASKSVESDLQLNHLSREGL
ncbi:hypothetical protein [Absidia glauca]|uniref:3'-5' exonuclease n=1 Tax=Absidia glauca TaxID=4829 RepID=A0A163KF32_ABSGL|nr:hypothetical protein [Absidia glauca]